MNTMKRGERLIIPESIKHEFHYGGWLFIQLNRFFALHTGVSLAFFTVMGLIYHNALVILLGLVGLELFYLSLAWHEASHFAMARIMRVRCTAVSLLATHFEIRTFFDSSRPIAKKDLYGIIIAGPMIPIITLILPVLFALGLRAPLGVWLGLGLLLLVQFISLLPLGRSDGRRVKDYLLANPKDKKILLSLPIYYFYCLFNRVLIKEPIDE